MLPLSRPLVCLDVESTGTNAASDRILELGLVVLRPDGSRARHRWLLNPGCPIPPAATAVHHYADADVAGAPGFVDVADEVARHLTGVDLAGFNLRAFDLPILRAEFERAGVAWPCEGARVVDAFVIYRERERRDLGSAVRFYCDREHVGAHGAVVDADATLDVLLAQLSRYPALPRDLGQLDAASGGRRPDWATELGHLRWADDGQLLVAFGKHQGKRLCDVDPGFWRWLQRNDFPADVKALCERVMRGERPLRPGLAPPAPTHDLSNDDFPI